MKGIFIALGCGVMGVALCAQAPSAKMATTVTATLKTAVNTKTAQTGQKVTAVVDRSIKTNGQVWLPKGSMLTGTVVQSTAATANGQPSSLEVVFKQAKTPGGNQVQLEAGISGFVANTNVGNVPYEVEFSPDTATGGMVLNDPRGNMKIAAGTQVQLQIGAE